MLQNNGVMDSVLDIFDLMAHGKVWWLNIVWCFCLLKPWPFILASCKASMKALGKAAKNMLRVPSFLISSLGPWCRIYSDVIWRVLGTCVVTYRNKLLHSSPVFLFCPSRLRENLLKLADTMKASGGWRLEDRFQTWAHAQNGGKSCQHMHLSFQAALKSTHYCTCTFPTLKLKPRFTLPKSRSLDGRRTVTIAVMLPREILPSLFHSGCIDKMGWTEEPSLHAQTGAKPRNWNLAGRFHKDLAPDIRSSWTSVPWLKLDRVMRLIFVVGHFSQTNWVWRNNNLAILIIWGWRRINRLQINLWSACCFSSMMSSKRLPLQALTTSTWYPARHAQFDRILHWIHALCPLALSCW